MRSVDTVARLAGDEFVVIAESLQNEKQDVETIASKILRSATVPFDLQGHQAKVSASIGLVIYLPGCELKADVLLARADQAMYVTKRSGKASFTIWHDQLANSARD